MFKRNLKKKMYPKISFSTRRANQIFTTFFGGGVVSFQILWHERNCQVLVEVLGSQLREIAFLLEVPGSTIGFRMLYRTMAKSSSLPCCSFRLAAFHSVLKVLMRVLCTIIRHSIVAFISREELCNLKFTVSGGTKLFWGIGEAKMKIYGVWTYLIT